MNEPGQPFLLFNYYDIGILLVLILLLVMLKYKFEIKRKQLFIVLSGLILFILVPYLSIQIEVNNAVAKNGIDDSFTLLYVFFKIPVWWFIGIVILFNISVLDFRKFIN